MSQTLCSYIALSRKIIAVLEEAIATGEGATDLIYIGGKNGLVLHQSKAETLLTILRQHEKITDEADLKEAVLSTDYPVIICDEKSVFFEFQNVVEEIMKIDVT